MIEKELAWQRIRQIAEEQAFITAKVESARPAGLIVKIFDSIQGFVPGSHVLEVLYYKTETNLCLSHGPSACLWPPTSMASYCGRMSWRVTGLASTLCGAIIWQAVHPIGSCHWWLSRAGFLACSDVTSLFASCTMVFAHSSKAFLWMAWHGSEGGMSC